MAEQLALQDDRANAQTAAAGGGSSTVGTTPSTTGHDTEYLRVFVFGSVFHFGGITSLNDVIIPKLKELFTLSMPKS